MSVTGAGATLTDAFALGEVAPAPMHVIEYEAFAVGETDAVPLVALVPDQLPLAVHEVAFVELQVRVDD